MGERRKRRRRNLSDRTLNEVRGKESERGEWSLCFLA